MTRYRNLVRKPRGDGLTYRERAVLDHWDDGKSVAGIVAATGEAQEYVKTIVSRFTGAEEYREARNEAATGSAQLLAALRASHYQPTGETA